MFRSLSAGLLAGCLASLLGPVEAEEGPPPFQDFTFRRVAPPTPGAGRRITVQIAPRAEEPAVEADPGPGLETAETPADGTVTAAYAWYWKAVSPTLADSGPGRLAQAVAALDTAPQGEAVRAPALQRLADIAEAHGTEILTATVGTRVSPALVLAMIAVESAGRADAVSPAGARGLMQLMPGTAARFGVEDSTDPAQNIGGGVAYLDWLMGEFGGDPVMVLASYNAGENAVRLHEGVPPYTETRGYVPKVMAAWAVARRLCLTPPELISDGCVFAVRVARDG